MYTFENVPFVVSIKILRGKTGKYKNIYLYYY